MDEGCAWIVVERAYTIHPLYSGQRPGGATGPRTTFLLPVSTRNGVAALTIDWPLAGARP